MNLTKTETELDGVLIIEPKVFPDERGLFCETYHKEKYAGIGIDYEFIQDNHSVSKKNVVRGLHYQLYHPQAKLIYVNRGEIIDIAVDIRVGSPSFGKFASVNLSEKNARQLFIPKGFAHGFCVLTEYADVTYKCSDIYTPGDDYGILWNDPELGINWNVENVIVSEKDNQNPLLKDVPKENLPNY